MRHSAHTANCGSAAHLLKKLPHAFSAGLECPRNWDFSAYRRLREEGLLVSGAPAHVLEAALLRPFELGGRRRNYRFPRQKARYLAGCLAMLDGFAEPIEDICLRNTLSTLPGIGPKTASWIVRNYRSSNAVAIIDVHILRAGRHAGLFAEHWTPLHHYHELETAFLRFATALETPASLLDGLMWDLMRRMPVRRNVSHFATSELVSAPA